MRKVPLSRVATLTALAAAVSLPTLAHAQTGGAAATPATPQADQTAGTPAQVGEVVVTGARLREEAVQKVPVTVSVIGARAIESLHGEDIESLTSYVPNVTITQIANSGGDNAVVFIRGFGAVNAFADAEPAVPIYVDGVYEPTNAGSLSKLLDVDRIEVLRGPQSTLLGKDSTAGAILVTHTRPTLDSFGADVEAEYGSYNLTQIQASANIPLIDDKLAIGLYGGYHYRDSYILNLFDNKHDDGIENYGTLRASLLYKPLDNLTIYLTGTVDDDRSQGVIGRNITPLTGTPCVVFKFCTNQANLWDVANFELPASAPTLDSRFTAQVDWNLGPVQLSSITGEKTYRHLENVDLDSTPLVILELPDIKMDVDWISEELRLSSVTNGGWDFGGRLSWMVGGFYGSYDGYSTEPFVTRSSPVSATSVTNQVEKVLRTTQAVFGHADFDLTSKITFSAGVRVSEDDVTHDYSLRGLATYSDGVVSIPAMPFTEGRTDDNTSVEGGVRYEFDSTKMIYFRYAQGYRGGGFTGFPSSAAQAAVGFGPETSYSYEVGAKTQFFDHRLLFDLTLFDVTYDNLQRTTTVAAPGFGFVITTANVAKARTDGVEIEADAKPLPGLDLRATMGYLDAKYLSYVSSGVDLSNTPFAYSPKWTLNLTPSYRFGMGGRLFDSATVEGDMDFRSGSWTGASNFSPQYFQPAYALFDAQLIFNNHDKAYTLTLYGKNLGDKRYLAYTSVSGGGPTVAYTDDPLGRTFGVSINKKF
jgi:iron complex outermembrane receptor protein